MSALLIAEDFLDAASCRAFVDELRAAESSAATTYGRANEARRVDESARRTRSVTPSSTTRATIEAALRNAMTRIGAHFATDVSDLEAPQFLRYRTGDFFVAHQDGNTKLLLADEQNVRRISTVLFLSEPDAYEGGALVFHHSFRDREALRPRAGTLIAFRAETTHEVERVSGGERFTVASWYR